MNSTRGLRPGVAGPSVEGNLELDPLTLRETLASIERDNALRRARVWTAWFCFQDGNAAEAVALFLRERAMSARVEGVSSLVVVEFHATLADAIVRRALSLNGALWRSDSGTGT